MLVTIPLLLKAYQVWKIYNKVRPHLAQKKVTYICPQMRMINLHAANIKHCTMRMHESIKMNDHTSAYHYMIEARHHRYMARYLYSKYTLNRVQ